MTVSWLGSGLLGLSSTADSLMQRRLVGASVVRVSGCRGPIRQTNIPAEEVSRRLHSMGIGGKVP